MTSMLVRLSIPGEDPFGGPLDEPAYGGQFQGRAIDGVAAEGVATLAYVEEPGAFLDGTAYSLRRPTVVFESLSFGPMAPDVMVSARVAPAPWRDGIKRRFFTRRITQRPEWPAAQRRKVRWEIADDVRTFLKFYGRPVEFWDLG